MNIRKSKLYQLYRYIYSFHLVYIIEGVKILLYKITNSRSEELRQLKGKFCNKRCFIVANGPSLTFRDLDIIADEYTFSMNSVIKVLDNTKWYPTFYGIQDLNVYEKIPELVSGCKSEYTFICETVKKIKLPLPKKPIYFRLLTAGHYADNPNPKFNFSEDASFYVYDGFSITYSLLQIACYLGFTEIYLLGCDCSYSLDPRKQHFANSGHVDPDAYRIGALQIKAFQKAKLYCDEHNIKVYNATRGGALEVFPRISLNDISGLN